ncbi:chimeric ERCC6-PGBD3 protein [Trichonephila clavata]|uniref:Chimeric ERCC6-PGBD3 protein n=1 Tax=Trichonephila clavata TaxID=2740835 RepID=A0A8X6GGM7_TRICU|nr:chimeric ERCC6-PGBD3 protein [Trichonephila clavata]
MKVGLYFPEGALKNLLESDGVASTSTNMQQSPPTKKRKPAKVVRKWKKVDPNAQPTSGRVTNYQSKGVNLSLMNSKLKCFLGIIFLSGYVLVPRRRILWEQRADLYNALISTAMRFDRFETIFSNLHIADNANLEPFDKWHDNSVVTVASSGAGENPLSYVDRYSQAQKKKTQVQQSNMIKAYSQFVGGVDRADENIDKYQAAIYGKKW